MRRILLIITAVSVLTVAMPVPDANAFLDPVTIAILAPIALKVAAIAKPYVIKGLVNMGKHSLKIGSSLLESLRFLLGLGQVTIGAPFGGLKPGFKNIVKGGLGFGLFLLRTIMLPVSPAGISI